ncbi:preprotein translocase subunit SecE [Saccharobesus litoralis]|uniref:Protein translocase subunit SecE n=1 Tax=Saccharobesus litoralis TaxID=2172099 RepID=A0A2S0VR72_9ALTE|nr:preprotein translocase subunit SecE [Saccharobesus litoralis]AWB66716.1 preprotein translocase subunit SecE [Saccharobesus litoralis]
MGVEAENQTNSLDGLKWTVSFAILAAIVAGNIYFAEQISILWRAVAIVVGVGAALFVAGQTAKGQDALVFAKDSRTEVRKVVWPTRQETLQTTVIVIIATLIMSLILWGLDGIMVRVVAFLTGLEL